MVLVVCLWGGKRTFGICEFLPPPQARFFNQYQLALCLLEGTYINQSDERLARIRIY